MSKHLTLFDKSPEPVNQYGYPIQAQVLARRDDPITSKVAAHEVARTLSATQQKFLHVLKDSSYPLTAAEISAAAYPIEDVARASAVLAKRETLRKRAGELVTAEKIRVVDSRECRVTGKHAQTYEVIK